MDASNTSSFSESSTNQLSVTTAIDELVNASIAPGNGTYMDARNFTLTSPTTSELVLYYNRIKTYIWTYIPPILITVGVICNLLALFVWIQSLAKKRGSSSSYFFACLAIADIIALLFLPMYDHIGKAYFNGINIRLLSNFTCKLYSFMFAFSLSFTSYILASLALFRMIGTLYPLRYKQICSNRNAKIIIFCVIIFIILAHIQTIFRQRLVESNDRGLMCIEDPKDKKTVRLFLSLWFMFAVYFLPMFVIVVSNACIIWKLFRKRRQSIGTVMVNKADHAFSKRRQSTRTMVTKGDHAFSKTVTVLVFVSLVFIITMTPMWVYVVLYVKDMRGAGDSVNKVDVARYHLGWAIVANVSLVNSMANFFVYCLAHPQFIPEGKLCIEAFAVWFRSHFQNRFRSNTVGIMQVQELELGTAGPSGLQATNPTVVTFPEPTNSDTISDNDQ